MSTGSSPDRIRSSTSKWSENRSMDQSASRVQSSDQRSYSPRPHTRRWSAEPHAARGPLKGRVPRVGRLARTSSTAQSPSHQSPSFHAWASPPSARIANTWSPAGPVAEAGGPVTPVARVAQPQSPPGGQLRHSSSPVTARAKMSTVPSRTRSSTLPAMNGTSRSGRLERSVVAQALPFQLQWTRPPSRVRPPTCRIDPSAATAGSSASASPATCSAFHPTSGRPR